MQGTELEQIFVPNTKCDIEIREVPSCAKCCILRIEGEIMDREPA